MRRFIAPLAAVAIVAGLFAGFALPRPGLAEPDDYSGCLTGVGTPAPSPSPMSTPAVGAVASPNTVARRLPVDASFSGPDVDLWLQRFAIGPTTAVEGCFAGYTLLWVDSGSITLTLTNGCVDDTPRFNGDFLNGTPNPASGQVCAPPAQTFAHLAAGHEALLVNAQVTITADPVDSTATIITAAVDPDFHGGQCGGRPC